MELQNDNYTDTLTTQGNATEQAEGLGSTTNLSLDQLKAEGGPANFSEDQDDLNEIRTSDDLNEPDPEDEDLDTTDTDLDGEVSEDDAFADDELDEDDEMEEDTDLLAEDDEDELDEELDEDDLDDESADNPANNT